MKALEAKAALVEMKVGLVEKVELVEVKDELVEVKVVLVERSKAERPVEVVQMQWAESNLQRDESNFGNYPILAIVAILLCPSPRKSGAVRGPRWWAR